MYVYVASSWRNERQPKVVKELRGHGYEVYDFKNPEPGNEGFHWSDVSNDWKRGSHDGTMSAEGYLDALAHPIAAEGFKRDFAAMEQADALILVLPCGRSAHLELGWAAGAGKPTGVLLDDPVTPELMYLTCDKLTPDMTHLIWWLNGVRHDMLIGQDR